MNSPTTLTKPKVTNKPNNVLTYSCTHSSYSMYQYKEILLKFMYLEVCMHMVYIYILIPIDFVKLIP